MAKQRYFNPEFKIVNANTYIGHFIEQVYNQKRPYSVLGFLISIEFEEKTCLNHH